MNPRNSSYSSKSGKAKVILLLVFIPVLLGGVVAALVLLKSDPYSTLEPFPTHGFADNPGNFYGNRYLMEGQIMSQLAVDDKVGKILSVIPGNNGAKVPVFVPISSNLTFHLGQRYKMAVYVKSDGTIYVEDMAKF